MFYCIVFISMIGVFWHTLNKDFRGLKGGKKDKLDQLVYNPITHLLWQSSELLPPRINNQQQSAKTKYSIYSNQPGLTLEVANFQSNQGRYNTGAEKQKNTPAKKTVL